MVDVYAPLPWKSKLVRTTDPILPNLTVKLKPLGSPENDDDPLLVLTLHTLLRHLLPHPKFGSHSYIYRASERSDCAFREPCEGIEGQERDGAEEGLGEEGEGGEEGEKGVGCDGKETG